MPTSDIPQMTPEQIEQQEEGIQTKLPATPRSTASKEQEEAIGDLQTMMKNMKMEMENLIKDVKNKDTIIDDLKKTIEKKKDRTDYNDTEEEADKKGNGKGHKGKDEAMILGVIEEERKIEIDEAQRCSKARQVRPVSYRPR